MTSPEDPETWETCSRYVQRHEIFFLLIAFPKQIVCFGTRFGYVKKLIFFITVFATIQWEKQAEPILLTSTLLMGDRTSDAGRAGK